MPGMLAQGEASQELARSWRKLTRAATAVALLTAPALFIWFTQQNDWAWWVSLLATLGVVIVFRGFAELLFRRLIPWPSLFGVESAALREAAAAAGITEVFVPADNDDTHALDFYRALGGDPAPVTMFTFSKRA